MSTENELVLESEDQILAFTHQTRKRVVGHLMAKGVPEDPESMNILLKTVDGMDRAALSRKRIKADEKATDTAAAASGLIAQVLLAVGKNRNHQDPIPTMVNRSAPMLGLEIPEPDLVEGECDVNPVQTQYNTFMSGFENENEEDLS